jgi:uncharacterized protein (TIRG00374 family)
LPQGKNGPFLKKNETVAPSFRFSWKMAAGLALMALFLWLAFRQISFGKFFDVILSVDLLPFLGSSTILTASHVLRGWRWKIMLSSSQPDLRRRHALAATIVGYAVNVIVPRGGEVARAIFLKRIARTSLAAGLSSVLAERLLDLTALCVLFPVTFWVYQQRLEGLFPGVGQGIFVVGVVVVVGLGLLWGLGRYPERMTEKLQAYLRWIWPKQEKRFAEMSENFLLGIGGLFNKENMIGIGVLSGFIWVMYIIGNWVLIFSFPHSPISSLTFVDAAAITVVVAISFVIPAPGGTGTTHFFVSEMLIVLYAIDPTEALAYATLIHLSSILPSLILGLGLAITIKSLESTD